MATRKKAFLASIIVLSLTASIAKAAPSAIAPLGCTDGGTLVCCAATFNGDNVPVRLATDLTCYDLTPATTSCLLPAAADLLPGLLGSGGDGSTCALPQCCHIPLNPLLGLYCGAPPGPCQGPEMPPRCLDVLGGRFGHCPGINPGTGRLVAATQGNAPARNPLGLDLGGLVGGLLGPPGEKRGVQEGVEGVEEGFAEEVR